MLAEDIIQQMCSLEDMVQHGRVPSEFCSVFSASVSLDRECRQHNPLAMEAKVKSLIYENSSECGVVIYTDGSIVRHVRSS